MMEKHGHAYQIATTHGNVVIGIPFAVPKNVESRLKIVVRHMLDESQPVEDLVDYIKELTPTAGTPRGALRGYLTAKEWSQNTLSTKTGISPAHISEMITGKRPIGPKIAKKFGKAFEVNYKRFL